MADVTKRGKVYYLKNRPSTFATGWVGGDTWAPAGDKRRGFYLLDESWAGGINWHDDDLSHVAKFKDHQVFYGGNRIWPIVKDAVQKHLLKIPKDKFNDSHRAFWKRFKNLIQNNDENTWNALRDRGIDLNEGGSSNLAGENLDKSSFEKSMAKAADLWIKNTGHRKGITTFAYISPVNARGAQQGLRLMLWGPAMNRPVEIAKFKSGGGAIATEPHKHDKENWTTMKSFEYYIDDDGDAEIKAKKGKSWMGNGQTARVVPAKNEAPIKYPLSVFKSGWERAWGVPKETTKMISLNQELKAHTPVVDKINDTQMNAAYDKFVTFANNPANPPSGHPCSANERLGDCMKKITEKDHAVEQLGISHMQYSQIHYVALVFLQFKELDEANRQAIQTHDSKGKQIAKPTSPEDVFKRLKKTTQVQRDSNLEKGRKEVLKGKAKIVAPVLSKEEIEASQRANMQCALLMNLKDLAGTQFGYAITAAGSKRTNRSDVIRVCYSGRDNKDQNQIINKLLSQPGSSIAPFMNITPEIASSMMPMIRLFKVGTEGRNLSETEFAFDSYTGQNPDRKTFTLDDVDRGDGVGIKEFSWSFHGGNPALSRKDIKAKLVMFFQTFQDFIKPRNGGKYRFVDLMLFGGAKPGEKAKKMGFGKYQVDQYDPSYYRIRADVGWSIRNDENFKDLVAARDFGSEDAKSALGKFNKALESINQTFFLNMVEHNIDIRKDGTVMVTAEYQAYIESATKTNVLDSLSTPMILKHRDDLNKKVESVLMKSCKGGKKRSSGSGASGRDVLLNMANTVEELYMESAYQSIMKRLIKRKLIQVRYIDKKHINKQKNPGKWESPPKLMTPGEAASIINSETTSKGRKKKKGNKSAQKNAKPTKPPPKAASSTVKGVFKLLPPDSKLIQLNYFYVNDLVDVIMDAKKGISGEHRPELSKTKIVLGSFEHDEQVINIGAIPVSTQYFFEWFTDNVISKKLKTFPVMTFIRSLTNHLISDMLHEACVTEKADATIEFRTTTAFGAGKDAPLKSTSRICKNVANVKPLRSFLKDGEDANRAWHYIIVYAMKTGRNKPHTGTGNAKEDGKRGIHHLHIGQNRGIVKHISFEKTDIQYAREARYMRHGFDGLGQIGAVYNAKIEMIGNTIFYPGMLLYIDPIGIGGRGFDPTNIRSEANALGFGGYHLVTKADSSITPSGYKTTVTAMFNYSGESLFKLNANGKRTSAEAETSPLLPESNAACSEVIGELQAINASWHLGKKPEGL